MPPLTIPWSNETDHRRVRWIVLFVLIAPILFQIAFALAPGVGSYVVQSSSMKPTFAQGSLIYVHESGHYTAGDIVTYTDDGTLITHRIIRETEDGFVTKGDANTTPDDEKILPGQIQGEVLVSVPLYGYLVQPVFAQSWNLYLILGGLSLIGLAGYHLHQS